VLQIFQTAEMAETQSAAGNLMKVWLCGKFDMTLGKLREICG
jgi:hypothetical protein